jgi:hypothetical protein
MDVPSTVSFEAVFHRKILNETRAVQVKKYVISPRPAAATLAVMMGKNFCWLQPSN